MLSRPLRRKRQKLCDVIVESVKRSIVTDALKPGDRLPTERELISAPKARPVKRSKRWKWKPW